MKKFAKRGFSGIRKFGLRRQSFPYSRSYAVNLVGAGPADVAGDQLINEQQQQLQAPKAVQQRLEPKEKEQPRVTGPITATTKPVTVSAGVSGQQTLILSEEAEDKIVHDIEAAQLRKLASKTLIGSGTAVSAPQLPEEIQNPTAPGVKTIFAPRKRSETDKSLPLTFRTGR